MNQKLLNTVIPVREKLEKTDDLVIRTSTPTTQYQHTRTHSVSPFPDTIARDVARASPAMPSSSAIEGLQGNHRHEYKDGCSFRNYTYTPEIRSSYDRSGE